MPGTTSYTSLEALLLFQYLRTNGITTIAFKKIAQQLSDDPQVRRDVSFDPARLTPDGLRDFFLRVWKEELRHQDNVNGTNSTSPRKRKATSPPLPTIQDAANNATLLPKLIIRLYGRYREQVVTEIRADETQYRNLQQELLEIRNGQWDARLQRQVDDARLAHSSIVNGSGKSSGPLKTSSSTTLPSSHARRDGSGGRSPSPNSTTIELPKTIPRPSIHPQPSITGTPQGRPLAANVPSSSRNPILSPPSGRKSQPPQNLQGSTYPAQPLQETKDQHVRTFATDRPISTADGNYQSEPLLQTTNQQIQTQGHALHTPSSVAQPLVSQGADNINPGQQPTVGSTNASQRGGIMLPPFQVAPQVPSHLQQQREQASHHNAPSPLLPRTQSQISGPSHPSASSTPTTTRSQHVPSPLVFSISKMLSNPSLTTTPVSSPGAAKRLAETKWKNTPESGVQLQPSRPRSRSVSPISDVELSPQPDSKSKARRPKLSTAASQRSTTATATRSSRSTRKTRGASVASSAIESSVRGRTRSQSVLSHVSVEPGTKIEPSTPNESMEIDLPPPSATRRATRGKRKRSPTATSDPGDVVQQEVARPMPVERTSILAVRNFQRLSNAIMNDILSHKHASIFSHPVRDRDADGYSSMIRRPMDLKSIKASIGAGARAVNASNSTFELLPWSEDLVPPKGIVNSAQLEREVMRVFANAVMFNPGEDDVVRDAREMFESAQESLMNFKSAEQRTETTVSGLRRRAESEASQQAAAHEDDAPVSANVGKRRKLG